MEILIQTAGLFAVIDKKLLELLRSLSKEDWNKPTIAPLWTVKDIAAHLLDGNLRTLSFSRDNHQAEKPAGGGSLLMHLNQLNADWIKATRRLSPEVLISLLETTGMDYTEYMTRLQPFEEAIFPVSWAGEEISKNYFHIAREYSEKWIHQQQIRDAVGKQGILTREFFVPFMHTLMQALPFTYRNVDAPNDTLVRLTISSPHGGTWYLLKTPGGWALQKYSSLSPAADITFDPDTAWKLFSKGISPEKAKPKTIIKGDKALGMHALNMVSVMA